MHSLKRISAMTLVYARKHHLKRRTQEFITTVTISTAGSGLFFNNSKALQSLTTDLFVQSHKRVVKQMLPSIDSCKTKSLPIGFDWNLLKATPKFEPLYRTNPTFPNTISLKLHPQKPIIEKIMEEDKSFTSYDKKSTIASLIVSISQKYGINPIHIACIAKKESHLTPDINSKNARGMMQITMGALRPMYKYPQNFSPKLDEIKKVYPTAEQLYTALGSNPKLNIEIGTIYFQTCLRINKGNLKKALEMYNNSNKKVQYANDVLANIKKYS